MTKRDGQTDQYIRMDDDGNLWFLEVRYYVVTYLPDNAAFALDQETEEYIFDLSTIDITEPRYLLYEQCSYDGETCLDRMLTALATDRCDKDHLMIANVRADLLREGKHGD